MSTHTPKHRHLVAVPLLLLLLLGLTAVHSVLPLSAMASRTFRTPLTAGTTNRAVDLPSGVAVILHDADLRADEEGIDLELRRGKAVFSVPTVLTLRLPGLTVRAADAAFTASASEDGVIVATLRGLLTVEQGSGVILLPGGFQVFRSASSELKKSTAPAEWVSEQMQSAPLPGSPKLSAAASEVVSLLQTGTGNQATGLWEQKEQAGISSHDAVSVIDAILKQKQMESSDVDLLLMAARSIGPSFVSPLLPRIALTSDLTPEAATKIITELRASDLSSEDLVAALPWMLRGKPQQIDDAVLSYWAGESLKAATVDPEGTHASITRSIDLPELLESAGYPLQARKWRASMQSALQMISVLLPALDRPAVAQELERLAGHEASPAIMSSSASSQHAPVSAPSPDELLAQAENLLSSSSLMRGAATTVKIVEEQPESVRIEGVYLSEGSEDVEYAFAYTPATGMLSDIVRAGVKLPNAVPAEIFLEKK